jgi:hypothetical protein
MILLNCKIENQSKFPEKITGTFLMLTGKETSKTGII